MMYKQASHLSPVTLATYAANYVIYCMDVRIYDCYSDTWTSGLFYTTNIRNWLNTDGLWMSVKECDRSG